MFSPRIAAELRQRGHDVVAVAAEVELRALSDDELWVWAVEQDRRIVTENAKDFRRLLISAEESAASVPGLLLTNNRRFPRSRGQTAALVAALDGWLRSPDVGARPSEDWLRPAAV